MFEVFSHTMGQFVQSSETPAKREPDHLCYGCKRSFRPHMLYRKDARSNIWRCRACYDKWLERGPDPKARERWQRWYDAHKEHKAALNRAYHQRKKAQGVTP